MTPAQRKVIKCTEDITSLCESAVQAYNTAGKNAKSKIFYWRSKKFRAKWSLYAVHVDDMNGNPIAERVW